MVAREPAKLGNISRRVCHVACVRAVLAAAVDDMEVAECDELEHSDDVYTDAWKLCVCWVVGGEVGC
jgi:hypothetical protein